MFFVVVYIPSCTGVDLENLICSAFFFFLFSFVFVVIYVPSRTGADLANLINQAALHGSAEGNAAVTVSDIDYAQDKIIMGPERKSAVIEEKNRKLVAYHEGGHAIVAFYTKGEMRGRGRG